MYPRGPGTPALIPTSPHPPALQQHLPAGPWHPKRQGSVPRTKPVSPVPGQCPQNGASVPRMRPVSPGQCHCPQFRAVPFPSSGPGVVPTLPSAHGGRVLHPKCASPPPKAAQHPHVGFVPSHSPTTPQAMGPPSPQWWDRRPGVSPKASPTRPAQLGEPQTGGTGAGGDRGAPPGWGHRAACWVALVTPAPGQVGAGITPHGTWHRSPCPGWLCRATQSTAPRSTGGHTAPVNHW